MNINFDDHTIPIIAVSCLVAMGLAGNSNNITREQGLQRDLIDKAPIVARQQKGTIFI